MKSENDKIITTFQINKMKLLAILLLYSIGLFWSLYFLTVDNRIYVKIITFILSVYCIYNLYQIYKKGISWWIKIFKDYISIFGKKINKGEIISYSFEWYNNSSSTHYIKIDTKTNSYTYSVKLLYLLDWKKFNKDFDRIIKD